MAHKPTFKRGAEGGREGARFQIIQLLLCLSKPSTANTGFGGSMQRLFLRHRVSDGHVLRPWNAQSDGGAIAHTHNAAVKGYSAKKTIQNI